MGLFGFDPRPAGLAPAGAVEHADVHAGATALADGVLDEPPPLGSEHLDGASRHVVEEDVADQRLADANPGHRFKVAGDPLPGKVVADPIPIAPRFGFRRRTGETGLKQAGRLRCHGLPRERQRDRQADG